MVTLFLQIIFFILIKFSFQSIYILDEPNIYSNNKETNILSEDIDISVFKNCTSEEDLTFRIRCLLDVTKNNVDIVKKIISMDGFAEFLVNALKIFIEDKKKYEFLFVLIGDFFNTSKPYINETFSILEKCYNSSSCILDNAINIVNYLADDEDNLTLYFFFENICEILNYPGFEKIIKSLDHNNKLNFQIICLYAEQSIYSTLFSYLENFLFLNAETINTFIYDILKNFKNFDDSIELFYNFISNNTEFMQNLKTELKNITVLQELSKAVVYEDEVVEGIKNSILNDTDIVDFFFNIICNKSIVNATLIILRNSEKGLYLGNDIINLIKEINNLGYEYYNEFLNIAFNALKKKASLDALFHFVYNNLIYNFKKIVLDYYNIFQFNISHDCYHLINSMYFYNITNMTQLRKFYVTKILSKSRINKNDLLFYENCLEKKNITQMPDLNFTVQPAFVIGIIDDIENKRKLRKSILNEKYNYLLALCLPYGIYKNSSNRNPMCSQNDYNNILKNFLTLSFNMDTSNITSMNILYKDQFEPKEYFFCIISIILAAIPLLIILFLYIYKKIKTKNNIKGKIINQLKSKKTRNSPLITAKENSINNFSDKLFVPPKWYIYLKSSFDLTKNFKELFNFEKYRTNFNNVIGITYIKGIQGIAMIFYVFGQTFLILCNLPIKEFKIAPFYKLIKDYKYFPILFIGLRYCPRIIFSCSGYTLMYKYLCFLEQGHDYYFVKFLFSQSHKYIMLILIALFMRYSIYYIDTIIWQRRRPMLEIFKYNFENSNENYVEHLFMCLMYYLGDEEFENRQNIIQYFYVPLNEIFFFIFGTILISLGYKFKIKIDFIIIFIFFFLYLGRFFMFTFELMQKELYPTLYFYLFGYGAIMINPFYNLPDFLIGMYFGIINYNIQRGVIIYKKENNSSHLKLWHLRENMNKKNEQNNNEFNDDEQINLFEFSKEDSQSYKFGKSNLEISLEEKETNDKYISSINEDISPYSNSLINNLEISKESSLIKNNISKNEINGEEEENEEKDINDEYDEKMKEMPFLIFPAKFLNFHRKIMNKWYFKIIIAFNILLILIFLFIHNIFISVYDRSLDDDKIYKEYLNKLSLEKVISNYALNIIYLLDMEIVVFIINFGFFIIYSKKSKNANLFDFFNNAYWSFFTKSYFSFISISSPVIIYIFYQSETVVELNMSNILLYSFISLTFILIGEIALYICYELPLKKIFKTFNLNYGISSMDYDLNGDDLSSNASSVY